MSNEIVRAGDAGLAPGEWQAIREQAKAVVHSGFLPKNINTPEKAITLMLAGRELGLGPMQSIRSLYVIDGKPVMSAELMAGLAHRRLPGATLRIVTSDNDECVVEAGRPGQQATRFTFTSGDAKAAGLLGKDNWRKYPAAMLRARCLAAAARATFPDVLLGVYDPDELGAITTPEGDVVSLPVEQVVEHRSEPEHAPPNDGPALLAIVQRIEEANDHDTLNAAKSDARKVWKKLSEDQRRLFAGVVEDAEKRLAGEREPGEEG